jgi:cytochrome oxidase assembly protein ShyY1
MRFGPLAFPWWTALVAAGSCAAGIALGNWQSDRAGEKRAIADRLAGYQGMAAVRLAAGPVAPGGYLWHKVEAQGEFDAKRTLFLGNRLYRGQSGYYVVTPLRIENGPRHVLVLRGWLPSGGAPPALAVPPGIRVIRGLAVPQVARLYEPGAPGHDRVRQNLDLAGFELESGLPLQPFFIEQRGVSDEGLVQDWPAHDALLDKHRMYAGQWYSLAALAVTIFLVLSFRHGRRPDVA